MARSTQIGVFFGIPVRVHVTLWILLPLIAYRLAPVLDSFVLGLLAATGLFASVALHELGHSRMAMRKGCRVREILLLPIGGMARLEGLPRRPLDEFLVAAAGPAVSLMLGLVLLGGAWMLAGFFNAARLAWLFIVVGSINITLVLFNLLPAFPMDGGRIFRAWMTPRLGRLEATRRAALVGRVMAVIFVFLALWSRPINWILIVIAFFVYTSAGEEYRMIRREETFGGGPFSGMVIDPRPIPPASGPFEVSPPPYERNRRRLQLVLDAVRDLFAGLFGPSR